MYFKHDYVQKWNYTINKDDQAHKSLNVWPDRFNLVEIYTNY